MKLDCLTINGTKVAIAVDPSDETRGSFHKGKMVITGDIKYGYGEVVYPTPRFQHDVEFSRQAAFLWPREAFPA